MHHRAKLGMLDAVEDVVAGDLVLAVLKEDELDEVLDILDARSASSAPKDNPDTKNGPLFPSVFSWRITRLTDP